MAGKRPYRLSVELDGDHKRWLQGIYYGARSRLVARVLDMIRDGEQTGQISLADVLEGRFELTRRG